MDMYRSQKSLIVIGQGAWEGPLLESTRMLDTVCCRKGIPTRFEYWGFDVDHDWPWWHKMVPTYLPWLLGYGFIGYKDMGYEIQDAVSVIRILYLISCILIS